MQDDISRYKNDDHYKSIRDDYMTPPEIYQPLLKFFNRDEFDIDVCCTKHNIPAKQHFTKEIDGLKQDWQGLCFCNPVWKFTNKWLKKGANLVRSGVNFIGCYVIPSDRLYVNYMQENIINNPQATFCILPGKQGYIIPGSEELPPVPSVGTMICILAANAPEIAAALNELQVYNTTFFVGWSKKTERLQLMQMSAENYKRGMSVLASALSKFGGSLENLAAFEQATKNSGYTMERANERV